MKGVKEVSDWGLSDLLAEEHPALLLGPVSSLSREHDPVLIVAKRLTAFYPDDLQVRFIDLVENPSVVGRLQLRKLPALILYRYGVEWARWEGAVDYKAVFTSVDELMSTLHGPD